MSELMKNILAGAAALIFFLLCEKAYTQIRRDAQLVALRQVDHTLARLDAVIACNEGAPSDIIPATSFPMWKECISVASSQ